MIKVFFSYSHENANEQNELEKHLAVLKRDRHIQTWHDRRILAGDDLNGEIDKNLVEANLVLLLVSPDFIASNYCYSIEMQKALERRQQGLVWVIPIILDHCDWLNTPLKDLRACPEDGKPVSDYPNPNRAYNEITNDIRRVIQEINEKHDSGSVTPMVSDINLDKNQSSAVVVENPRSSNLRIKREFTDYDRDAFKKEAFDYIYKYFHNSLEELKQRNQDIQYIFELEANQFFATVYRSGKELTSCAVVNRQGRDAWGGITYSYSKNESCINDALNVKDDGYNLYLYPMLDISGCGRENLLSKNGAAEYYWDKFISHLQN